MKTLSQELRDHIQNEVTTLCRCWIIETVSGDQLGFTDHDQDLTVQGVLCERRAGAEASSIEERLGLNIDGGEIAGALQSALIEETDILAGKYDGGRITTYLVNWTQPDQFITDRVMLIGEIHQEDGEFRFEMRGVSSLLDQSSGRHFIKTCQADLGDSRCRVNLNSPVFSANGTVNAVNSEYFIDVNGLGNFETGWFSFGHLKWTAGANIGLGTEITSHTSMLDKTILGLWQPASHQMAVGDEFVITAGCDKQFSTCKSKFANQANFQGFPHMPGDNFALNTAGNSILFDGSPVIP